MVRDGRIIGADLGPGTISYYSPTATRRIIAVLKGTTSSGDIQFTQGQTYMSQIDAAAVIANTDLSAVATGSTAWNIKSSSGGTITINAGAGVGRDIPVKVILIGTPDTNRIA